MIQQEKIDEINKIVTNGEELTTKRLKEIGLDSKKIKQYVDAGIITRVSRGFYQIEDINCIYKELYDSIMTNELSKVFELCEKIYNKDNSSLNKVILYLVNDIYTTSRFKEIIKNLTFDDYKYKKQDLKTQVYNGIISNMLSKKDRKALYIFNIYLIDRTVQDKIIFELLNKRCKKVKNRSNKICKLVDEKKYDEVIEILNRVEERTGLNTLEECLLYICNQYNEIKKSSKVPEVIDNDSNHILEVLKCNDFKKAYNMCLAFNNDNFILREDSSLFMLLEDINKLIDNINNKITISDVVKNINNNSNDLFSITNIIDKYLKYIGHSKYSSIVLDVLKLDYLNEDTKYTLLRQICNGLENNNYIFYTEYYVKQFYRAISHKQMDKATTYLDIINNGITLGYECPIISLLEDVLKYTKKYYNHEEIIFEDNTISYTEDNIVEEVPEDISVDSNEPFNYYNINNIDEIANLVSNGTSIVDACVKCNLTKEQTCLIYLLYAKEYYMDGDFEIGDRLFKCVEQSSDKTNIVIKEMQKIQKNKKFYMYREDNQRRLIKNSNN